MTDRVHCRAMNMYRFFTVNELDAVITERCIHCADDADARTIGEALVTEAYGVEVWDVGRRVMKLACAVARASSE